MKDTVEKKKNPIINYLEESFRELKKVTWPTRNQAVRLTILVLAFCLASAIVIGAMDALFNYGYHKLIEIAPASNDVSAAPAGSPVTPEASPLPSSAATTGTPPVTAGTAQGGGGGTTETSQ